MRGVYTASSLVTAVTTGQTLMYATAPSNVGLELLSVTVANATNETNEQLDISVARISSLGTPTATTITPAKSEQGDQAAASTWKADVSASEPTYDTNAYDRDAVPSLSGYKWQPAPEERTIVKPGESFGIKNNATMTSLDLVVTVRFREVG